MKSFAISISIGSKTKTFSTKKQKKDRTSIKNCICERCKEPRKPEYMKPMELCILCYNTLVTINNIDNMPENYSS